MHLITSTCGQLEAKHRLISLVSHIENRVTGQGVFTKKRNKQIYATLTDFFSDKILHKNVPLAIFLVVDL